MNKTIRLSAAALASAALVAQFIDDLFVEGTVPLDMPQAAIAATTSDTGVIYNAITDASYPKPVPGWPAITKRSA